MRAILVLISIATVGVLLLWFFSDKAEASPSTAAPDPVKIPNSATQLVNSLTGSIPPPVNPLLNSVAETQAVIKTQIDLLATQVEGIRTELNTNDFA